MKKSSVLPTQNESWGFFGTVISNCQCSDVDAQAIWDLVSVRIKLEFGLNAEQVRELLDSKYGRHIADACVYCEDADRNPCEVGFAGFPMWMGKTVRNFFK